MEDKRERLSEFLTPEPLYGPSLRFYVERAVDKEYKRAVSSPRLLGVFVYADRGFGKSSSANYWAAKILPGLGYTPIIVQAMSLVDVFYQAIIRIVKKEHEREIWRPGAWRLEGAHIARLGDRADIAKDEWELGDILIKLDEALPSKYMVIVDELRVRNLSEEFLGALDCLLQRPRRVFFTLMGTPRVLGMIAETGEDGKAVYEKLRKIPMPHFTLSEAREVLRRRVEAAGFQLDEVIPPEALKEIYELSNGPRELLSLAAEYVRLGSMEALRDSIEAKMAIREIEVLDEPEKTILKILSRGPARFKILVKRSGLSSTAAWYKLLSLMDRGLVRKKKWGVYSLTSQAMKALRMIEE